MNKEFLDYVRTLSIRDKKTLSQKALKTAEEVGELARVVLPYDSAYATNHRFANPIDILEECIDTTLCSLSIAYQLGFSDDEIDEMFLEKSKKWARLQANEDKAQFPLPYEIHVTVKASPWLTFEFFDKACKEIGVKPIILDLQRESTVVLTDVMTSSKHFGDNKSAYLEAQRISHELQRDGWEIARIKIETVPWHPAAPQEKGDQMPQDCYFESHIAVRLSNKIRSAFEHRMAALHVDVHLSKNPLKVHADGSETVLLTYRQYVGTRGAFERVVERIHEQLNFQYDYVPHEETRVGKPITEFSIYDTKVSHDATWILGNDGTNAGPIQDA